MSDGAVTVVANGRDQALNSGREVRTVLLCRNSLAGMGLQRLLEGTCFALSGMVADAAALPHWGSGTAPDLLIIDGSGSVEKAAEVVRLFKDKYPDVRIAVIAGDYNVNLVLLGLDAGVNGFCSSGSSCDVLIKSLELVMLGEVVLPTALVSPLLNMVAATAEPKPQDRQAYGSSASSDPRAGKFSNREAEILGCLMEGASNKVIARRFDVAEATVKVHVKAILRKIGAANRTQAAMWASTHLPRSLESSLNS